MCLGLKDYILKRFAEKKKEPAGENSQNFEPAFFVTGESSLGNLTHTLAKMPGREKNTESSGNVIYSSQNYDSLDVFSHNAIYREYRAYVNTQFFSVLVVVGNEKSDTISLTSPFRTDLTKIPGSTFTYSEFCEMQISHLHRELACKTMYLMNYNPFNHVTERYKGLKLKLDKHNPLLLFVVDDPSEYFPMLFVNCSEYNMRKVYMELTTMMKEVKSYTFYSPNVFIRRILAPVSFRIDGDKIVVSDCSFKTELPDDIFIRYRNYFLLKRKRRLLNDNNSINDVDLVPITAEEVAFYDPSREFQPTPQYFKDPPPLYLDESSDTQ
ncbi:hypothetical protein, no similarity [Maudiozyma saulgeensis]|uniref:Uncharacterized protein n=1 Tax=Maudiozyma saulgeensis TaxID=1789683 RepID=A0A1X7R9S5_9SACH|nr:hypothetical protein, no similarity [Kazachstania saulgeensis]